MPIKLHNNLPEKDHAIWLALGLVFLAISQIFSKKPGLLAEIFRWIFLAAAVINYGTILYLYERDHQAKKREQSVKENSGQND